MSHRPSLSRRVTPHSRPLWGALALGAALACALPFGCSSTPTITGAACSKDIQVACGAPCDRSSDCGSGLYCGPDGTCTADCVAATKDPICEGSSCEANGRCSGDGGIGAGDLDAGNGGGGPGAGGGAGCIDVEVKFAPQIPNVLLLIDRSGSMNADSGFGDAVDDAVNAGDYELGNCPSNNDWRWNVVRDVLLNTEKGVVKPLEDRVRFGLSLYTSLDGDLDGNACPMLEDVGMKLDNHAAMLDAFQCSDFTANGDTPTGPALLAAADTLADFDQPGPKVIVLATDGEPDDCDCPDFNGGECDADAAQAVKDDVVTFAGQVQGRDITVHVINVSNPNNAGLQTHLAAVAEAGGGNVYPGFNPLDLANAFEEIIDGARSCKIDLEGSIAAGGESQGVVTLDGKALELGGADGWRVNNPRQIELRGSACLTIKDGEHALGIDFPCGAFEPPVTR